MYQGKGLKQTEKLEQAYELMSNFVTEVIFNARKEGRVSPAHELDHFQAVDLYGGAATTYFARQSNLDPGIRFYTKMSGRGHDLVRFASQVESGEEASAILLAAEYPRFRGLIPEKDYQRFIVEVVRNSDKDFKALDVLYKDKPKERAIALGLVVADKLIEASGPRVLERRSFFVGKERMQNPADLGRVLRYPEESDLGVLSETIIRLYDVNHVDYYAHDPHLKVLADTLHAWQYPFYRGLLQSRGLTEGQAATLLAKRLESVPKLAERFNKAVARLKDERHLESNYLKERGFNKIVEALKAHSNPAVSSRLLVEVFALADNSQRVIEDWRSLRAVRTSLPSSFTGWMADIVAYQEGSFERQLLAALNQ